jgi:hypothetical protein
MLKAGAILFAAVATAHAPIPLPKPPQQHVAVQQRVVDVAEFDRWTDPISIFTFLLVVVGATQAWFLYQTNIGTQKAADAAKASADAVVSQLRAYISMKTKEGIPSRFDPVAGPIVYFDLKNTGQTPAFELTHWIRAAIGPADYDGPFEMGESAPEPAPLTLAPQAVINLGTTGPAPLGNDAARFAAGQIAAFIFGEIRYRDAFGHQRFYKYRYRLKRPDPAGLVSGLDLCGDGNEAN